jgi:gliding motility-associated-like protein
MKYYLSLLFFSLVSNLGHAQDWVLSNHIAGTQIEPKSSCIDAQNNSYVLTVFLDYVTYPVNLTTYGRRDIILTKYDDKGNFLWNTQIGSDSIDLGGGITLNSNGEILITGCFSKVCNFSGSGSLTSSGGQDIFMANYSTNGQLNWVKKIAWGPGLQNSSDIITDESSILVTGYYTGTTYVGNLPSNIDTLAGSVGYNSFLAKFDLSGNLLWTKVFPSTGSNTTLKRICITQDGYFLGGSYDGSITLGSTTLTTKGSVDMFLYKTNFNGDGEWIRTFTGTGSESFRSIETDEYQNAYILASYSSTLLTVDSTATDKKTYGNIGGYDNFIAKYNRSGNMQWFNKKGSSANDYFYDIAIKNNIIYSTGYFAHQIIFNNDTLHTTGTANKDAFICVYNEIGKPITGASIIGTGNYDDAGVSVCIGNASQAYIIGQFKSSSITIGDSIYTNTNPSKPDQFLAMYQHPFTAVITAEKNISCNGLSDGMLTVTGYFGTPPYTYSWSHNSSLNNPVASGLAPGDYSVTITDQNNNTASVSRTITQTAPISINGVVTQATCYNYGDGSINLTVTGGTKATDYVYRWSTLNGSGIIPINEDQNGLSSGTYKVEVADDNLCTASRNFIVVEPAPFDYTGSFATNITIPPGGNGAVNISITGGNTPYSKYEWGGPSGYTATTKDIAALSNAGLYYFTLTDAKGCKSDTSYAVIDNFTLVAQITAKADVTCYGKNDGTAAVTVYNASGLVSYAWSGFAPTPNNTIANMPPGKYTVTVTDGAANTAHDTITIFEPKALYLFPLDVQSPLCNGDNKGVVNLTLSGGTLPYQYNWNNGYYTGEDLVNVPGGAYNVDVTDASGCLGHAATTLVEPPLIGLYVTIEDEILCHGGNSAVALAHGSGGTPVGSFSYLWDDPGAQITPYAYELEAGTYNVTITDSNGCVKSTSVDIPDPDQLSVTAILNAPSCPGDDDGSIVPTPSGGTGTGYEYIWSNNVFQRFNTDLEAGQYILTMNDANNCILVDTFNLEDPDTLKIVSVTPTAPTCEGLNDGRLVVTATGGTGAYDYSTDGGTTYGASANIQNLPEGNYTVIVRDNKDCLSEEVLIPLELSETCGLIIYDAFSPDNGDDLNDEWIIENADNFPGITVKVFNIWGIEVFSSKGYGDSWDGIYNGKLLPSGTYYYVIDPGNGAKVLSGPVNIVY